jgi:hypothetical protein
MAETTQSENVAPPIFEVDTTNWECKPAVESNQDATTFNCYFVGEAKSYAFQGNIPEEAHMKVLDNGVVVTPEMRSKAIDGFSSVVLSELHQKGGKYCDIDKNQQPLLIRPNDAIIPFLDMMNEWVPDQMVKNHVEWGVEWEDTDMTDRDIRRKHISLWKKQKKSKDGKPPLDGKSFNARVFQDGVKIYIQDENDCETFYDTCRLRDIPKGAQCAFVMEFGGIRIRSTNGQYALMTPTVKEIWVFSRTKSVSGTAAFKSAGGPKIRKTGFKIKVPPPAADPPVADPPVADPPVADPPVADPPAADPPTADPPVADEEPDTFEEDIDAEGPGTATMIDA